MFVPEIASEGQVVVAAGVNLPASLFKPWPKDLDSRSPTTLYEADLKAVALGYLWEWLT